MREKILSKHNSKYIILIIMILLLISVFLGYRTILQSQSSIQSQIQTRMLDVSNTAAGMINGDILKEVTPEDAGTDGYESIMHALRYFQNSSDVRYIYCIRDMGDGTFSLGLDPTEEDPGEFGSPIVYTDALYLASTGTSAADSEYYEDQWGRFCSAYSPVFDSEGKVAGIVAADFSAEWYSQQVSSLIGRMIFVGILAFFAGAGAVVVLYLRRLRRMEELQGQLNNMAATLMEEMGTAPSQENLVQEGTDSEGEIITIDTLERQIESMRTELKTQIAQMHGQAYRDGLTGVKSRLAYFETEKALDEKLKQEELPDFGVVVCDVNGLKKINDSLGHKAGDEHIIKACRMICEVFDHSPVYRVGGDEFAVILTGRDYENREELMRELHRISYAHIATNDVTVSGGLSVYIPSQDHSVREIFERADLAMYEEKTLLRSVGAKTRGGMQDSRFDEEELPVINVRKYILIADDVESNREILGDLLKEDYGIYYAANGVETMEMLRKHKDEIAILLLDLVMPGKTGREVMTEMQVDDDLMSIPVIVLTSDYQAELDSLKVGAMDFIPKPYPDIEIIKARIAKCIELSEYRDLIRATQKDKLTGLFNIDYFIRYVQKFDRQYKETSFDALVCDVNQFRSLNEQYGRQFGDWVLHSMGISIRKLARKTGGIGSRQGIDTFLLYCPHRQDYEELLDQFLEDTFVEEDTARKVRLRFGVYEDAGKEADIEERFLRAKSAADAIEEDPDVRIGYYSSSGKKNQAV